MQEQIHNLCDLLLLGFLLSVRNANAVAESSCDCTAIVWVKHNATRDQISLASKTRHASLLDNSSGLCCQSKPESDLVSLELQSPDVHLQRRKTEHAVSLVRELAIRMFFFFLRHRIRNSLLWALD